MTVLIEASAPASWQDLEARVAQILSECGYDVERQKDVPLARGDVNIDVWADDHSSPQNIIAVECNTGRGQQQRMRCMASGLWSAIAVRTQDSSSRLPVSRRALSKLPPTRTFVSLTGLISRPTSSWPG